MRRAAMLDGDAEDAARARRLAMNGGHLVLEQDLDPGLARRGLERPHQPVARGHRRAHRRIGRLAGLYQRPVHGRGVHLARHRVADPIPAAVVGRLVDEDHAMRDEPFEGGGAVVGEGADDLAVVVAVIGKAVAADHRPVRQVAEEEIGRVGDAVPGLSARASPQGDVATAGDGVAADIRLRLDQDHRGAGLARDDGRGQARRPRADHDDIRLARPSVRECSLLVQCRNPLHRPTRRSLDNIRRRGNRGFEGRSRARRH